MLEFGLWLVVSVNVEKFNKTTIFGSFKGTLFLVLGKIIIIIHVLL